MAYLTSSNPIVGVVWENPKSDLNIFLSFSNYQYFIMMIYFYFDFGAFYFFCVFSKIFYKINTEILEIENIVGASHPAASRRFYEVYNDEFSVIF
jgi:hypothetical protein